MKRTTLKALTRHPEWNDADFARLSASGLSNDQILARWNEQRASRAMPVYRGAFA